MTHSAWPLDTLFASTWRGVRIFTIVLLLFRDLRNIQPSPGGLTQEPLLSPWLFLVATAIFFFDQ